MHDNIWRWRPTNFGGLGERHPAREEAIFSLLRLCWGGTTRLDGYLPNPVLQTGRGPMRKRGAHLPP
jgi:hypothetical protein